MRARGYLTAAVVLAASATACFPNAPTSVLPSGVSVEWERDTGGVVDAFGGYGPAWETRITNASTTVGPYANGVRTPPPTGTALGSGTVLPDGTAKFPWNGYAGESISVSGPPGALSVTFPGGTCALTVGAFDQVRGVAPSPDGTKAAVLVYNGESDTHTNVSIIALQSAARCPRITAASYTQIGSLAAATGSSVTNPSFVWKPDSSAIVYQEDPGPNQYLFGPAAIVRLDAVAGATPQTVIAATALGTPGCRTPLGWSTADRLLVMCWDFPLVAPLTITSTIETVASAGGTRRVLDTATLRRQVGSDFELVDHYGYFVPGTSTVIYNSGATTSGTPSFPAFQIRTIDDQAAATSSAFTPVVTATHNESQAGTAGPPYPQLAVPNADLVDRFGH